MSSAPPTRVLKANQFSVPAVVFFVLAAVAPVIVAMLLAIGFGNGGGIPVAVLIVAAAPLLFAVGYAQISEEFVNAGGFYAIAVKGFGRPAGRYEKRLCAARETDGTRSRLLRPPDEPARRRPTHNPPDNGSRPTVMDRPRAGRGASCSGMLTCA